MVQSKWKMIPSSRPKLSDLYTLSQSKLLENHTFRSGTYLYRSYMVVPPPPNGMSLMDTELPCHSTSHDRMIEVTFTISNLRISSLASDCLMKGDQ